MIHRLALVSLLVLVFSGCSSEEQKRASYTPKQEKLPAEVEGSAEDAVKLYQKKPRIRR